MPRRVASDGWYSGLHTASCDKGLEIYAPWGPEITLLGLGYVRSVDGRNGMPLVGKWTSHVDLKEKRKNAVVD
jgi:hypothetical protein